MYQRRILESFILKANKQFPVLCVTGPRQVGKTTLLKHLTSGQRAYVTLDDPLLRELAREEPALFLQRFPAPVLIDEIQYAPQLLPYIKMQVDEDRQPGAFWITGSQQFHLMKDVSESLAGRVGIVNLLGLSQREYRGDAADTLPFLPGDPQLEERQRRNPAIGLQEVYTRIWRGSFPALALDETLDRDLFYSSYLQTYLQRDVRDLAKIGDERAFLHFLRSTAARTGQLLNFSDLAREADVSPVTAKSWLSILITSGILYLLEPYHSNLIKRLVKSPKLYYLDTGLCAYLTEWSSPRNLEAGAMSGPILETWILGEILKSYLHAGQRAPLYFYRDKDKKEIDLLLSRDGRLYPLEFKKSAAPKKSDLQPFGLLERLGMEPGPGGIICLAERMLPLAQDCMVYPLAVL